MRVSMRLFRDGRSTQTYVPQVEVDGGDREGVGDAVLRLWRQGGAGIFWDGLGPKLARAVVNHAVTFLVFEEFSAALMRLQG